MLPDTGVCSISPSDMMGQLDNMLSRIEELEKTVAELKASNTEAIQLSDLSQSVGWVYDVEYMGIPGWTQTQAGTLIPPDGFTVSEILANAQAAQLAANASSGSIIGGGSGGSFSWAQVNILASGGSITAINVLSDTDGIISVSSPTITITSSGLYLFTMQDAISVNHTAVSYGALTLLDASFGLPGQSTVCNAGFIAPITSGTKYAKIGTSLVTTIPSNSYDLTAQASASAGTWTHIGTVSILKLA